MKRKSAVKSVSLTHIHFEESGDTVRLWPNNQYGDQFLVLTFEEFNSDGLHKLIEYLPGFFIHGMPED